MANLIRTEEHLFVDGDLRATLAGQGEKLKLAVEQYDANRLLNTPVEDLVDYFHQEFSVAPLVLHEEQIEVEQVETTIPLELIRDGRFLYPSGPRKVPGVAVSFRVPFSGESALFKLQPNTFSMNPPRARVDQHALVFSFATTDPDSSMKAEFEAELRNVKQHLDSGSGAVNGFNNGLLAIARTAIEARRARLLKAQNTVASLGYPMRRRDGVPQTYAAPTVRRKVVRRPPPNASSAPFKPEPTVPLEEYEHILDVMANMALVLERSPRAFKDMGEEDLRQHFLVQLNGHYEGSATGETFNVEGKTDILIRDEGRNLFIAECKFWRGPAGLTATIDQLLGYASWRDTKTAIVVFNRDVAFSTVLNKIPDVVRRHPNFKREQQVNGEGRFRAVLHHKADNSRELVLTVMAFDVPG